MISLALALGAVGIAVYQVRQARKASRLHGRIVATQTHLAAELAGRRDPIQLERLLRELFLLVEELGDIDPRADADGTDVRQGGML